MEEAPELLEHSGVYHQEWEHQFHWQDVDVGPGPYSEIDYFRVQRCKLN